MKYVCPYEKTTPAMLTTTNAATSRPSEPCFVPLTTSTARPYKWRTVLAVVSLLGATAASLVPPILIGRASR